VTAGAEPQSAATCPVLAGTTAIGKTDLVLSLARRFPIEIISLDSRQIYHGMRIGTAQPTETEKAVCAHHLVDFVCPTDQYSAVAYRHDFARVYQEIRSRNRLPVLVGGAGMYLAALQEGLFDLPDVTAADTMRLREELTALSEKEIRRQLLDLDAESWQRIHPHDRYRSQRALEICLLAGRSMTELMREHAPQPVLDLDFPLVLLQRSAEECNIRIAARTAAMFEQGWLEETEDLLEQYGSDAPGLAAIGYREIVAHLRGELAATDLAGKIITSTRQYAKRQRTWFRNVPREIAGAPEDPQVVQTLERLITAALA